MNKRAERKRLQRIRKRYDSEAKAFADDASRLVQSLRERVEAIEAPPPTSAFKVVKRHAKTRTKRQHNLPNRFIVGGMMFESVTLNHGLMLGYPQRGGIWFSSLRKWGFPQK